MQNVYLAVFSIGFSALIVFAALAVLAPFMLSIVWAGIIAVASWPVYRHVRDWMKGRRGRAALATSVLATVTIVVPMFVLLVLMLRDAAEGIAFLKALDAGGLHKPEWLQSVPIVGGYFSALWDQWLSKPDRLAGFLEAAIVERLATAQGLVQSILLDLSGRLAIMFFALWVLYFFYRDGEAIVARIHRLGYKWLPRRWPLYAHNIPRSIRAAVNGLVLVGLGEGVAMSLLFAAAGVPAPVTLGTAVALVALIPAAGPALLALIGLGMFLFGHAVAGVVVFVVGTPLILVAENVIRPVLSKGSDDVPFLLTLFGIFGGLALMGIVGLVIGPVMVALMLVLLREGEIDENADLEF